MLHRKLMIGFAFISFAVAQLPDAVEDSKLPNGKSQREEILRHEHQKSLEDSGELLKLAEDLKMELEKNDRHVLSVSSLKKTEQIEKLAKRIRSCLKRF